MTTSREPSVYCPACSTANPPEERACAECGTVLPEVPASERPVESRNNPPTRIQKIVIRKLCEVLGKNADELLVEVTTIAQASRVIERLDDEAKATRV